jgi:uncharacterized protein
VNGTEPYGLSDTVLTGFLRVVTHPRIFHTRSGLESAVSFIEAVRNQPNAVVLRPGPRHWWLFLELCRAAGARGNLVPDAYLAALAIDTGSELITTDRDFARFPGLRWRHPLERV